MFGLYSTIFIRSNRNHFTKQRNLKNSNDRRVYLFNRISGILVGKTIEVRQTVELRFDNHFYNKQNSHDRLINAADVSANDWCHYQCIRRSCHL